jgi:type I restriction enzyme S subunit
MKLIPYPEYKDSGVSWLGNVPSHWETVKVKYLFSERVEKGYADQPLLAATQTKGVIPKTHYESRTVIAQMDLHLLKLVNVGDFVISLRSFQGGLEYAYYRGIISPAYTVMIPMERVIRGYFRHILKSAPFVKNLSLYVTGIRQGQNIDYFKFKNSLLLLPPEQDQKAIASFLDFKTKQISRFILGKRRLIELLKEQKQAIINRAVTRGLDPNVRLKHSGVDWLGDIPEHWQAWQIGHFSKIGNGSTPSRSNPDYWSNGNYPWLNSSCVNSTVITHAHQFVSKNALRECHLPIVQPDNILVAITGQGKTRGMAALLKIECTINQHLAYITIKRNLMLPNFLHKLLQGIYQELRKLSEGAGSTKGALTCNDLKHLRVPVPPLNEQRSIVGFLDEKYCKIDTAIARAEREIELIREYRTRLIADVVTGKIDVRDVPVTEIPEIPDIEETEEPDSANEPADAAETGEVPDEDD